jgi:glycosyltransferase involved in cell wall biosynthesis
VALIGLDARKFFDFGIGTYIENLVSSLANCKTAHQIILFVNEDVSRRIKVPDEFHQVIVPYGKYSVSELLLLGYRARRERVDLFHCPHYTLPIGLRKRSVVTVHDLIHLHTISKRSFVKRTYVTRVLSHSVRHAGAIITISQYAKNDIVSAFSVDPDRITVVPLAVSSDFQPAESKVIQDFRTRFNIGGSYVLYVGNIKPHKNFTLLVHAMRAIVEHDPNVTLVCVGERFSNNQTIHAEIQELGLASCIREVGFLSRRDLVAAYSGASVHVLPSDHEGFGLPVLEAMACGAPVVVSDSGALPEVAGDAAILFRAGSRQSLECALLNVLSNPARRTDLIVKGKANVSRFSWEKTAQHTLEVYESVLSQ